MSSEGTPSIIECPECLAKLRLRNAATPGKKIICPKCQTTFVVGEEPVPVAEIAKPAVKEPAPPPEEDLEEEQEERPVKPKRKKKKSKESDSSLGKIISFVITCILIGGAVYKVVNSGGLGGLFGSKQEAMIQSLISHLEEMATVLESVKDESSAAAAAPKIVTIHNKLEDLRKSLEDVKVARWEDNRLTRKYESKIQSLMVRLSSASRNAGRIGGRVPAFQDAVMKMQSLSSF